jgi:hypothetical protein
MLPYISTRKVIQHSFSHAAASDVKAAFQYVGGKLGASTDERENSYICSTWTSLKDI